MEFKVWMNFCQFNVWSVLKKLSLFKIFWKSVYLFINNCLVPFKVRPLRCSTLMPAFFLNLETLLKHAFWYCQQLLFSFFFYLLKRSKTLFFYRCPLNAVVEAWLWFCFCQETHAQASMCVLVHYHGAKFMNGFSTILCVVDKLFRVIGVQLQANIPYWPYILAARIHDSPHHCNRRIQWAKSSHLIKLDVLFSHLTLPDAFVKMIIINIMI